VQRARNNLDARLAKLEDLVTKVVQDNQTNRQTLETYRRDIEKAKTSAAVEAKRFVENSQYTVSIQFATSTKDLAEKAQDILARAGFKAAIADIAQLEHLAAASATAANVAASTVAVVPTGFALRRMRFRRFRRSEIFCRLSFKSRRLSSCRQEHPWDSERSN
jgi:hypothetical protein